MFLAVWAEVKHARHETWVWAATDVKTKLIPVIQVSDRSQKAAYQVIHELKHMPAGRLYPGLLQ